MPSSKPSYMLGPAENHVAEVLDLGKTIAACLLLLSCVLFSAFAIIPGGQNATGGLPDQASVPTAPDVSEAAVIGTIDFSPSVLNLQSAGKYVTLRLSLPEGVSVSSVFVPSLRFMGSVYAETCFSDHETGAHEGHE